MVATAPTKIRTNVYLDSDMKAQAKAIFKKYGVFESEVSSCMVVTYELALIWSAIWLSSALKSSKSICIPFR